MEWKIIEFSEFEVSNKSLKNELVSGLLPMFCWLCGWISYTRGHRFEHQFLQEFREHSNVRDKKTWFKRAPPPLKNNSVSFEHYLQKHLQRYLKHLWTKQPETGFQNVIFWHCQMIFKQAFSNCICASFAKIKREYVNKNNMLIKTMFYAYLASMKGYKGLLKGWMSKINSMKQNKVSLLKRIPFTGAVIYNWIRYWT